MAKISDINKYKNNRLVKEDLEAILMVVNLTIKALQFYSMYNVCKRITDVLKEEKIIIEAEINKCKKELE